MKNKTSLLLMELLIMVLVFALASAICLRVFARSHEISEAALRQDRAVQLAQNTAETVKACADLPEAARILGAQATDDGWLLEQDGCSVLLTALQADTPGLSGCEIAVTYESETFRVNVFWQEVAP